MFLPEVRRLGVTLHCQEHWDQVTFWDGGLAFVVCPPFVKCLIRLDIKPLLRRWGLHKCVTYVGPIDKEVFGGGDGIKLTGTCLVNAVCVDLVGYLNIAVAA
jgi:hypothetical protein